MMQEFFNVISVASFIIGIPSFIALLVSRPALKVDFTEEGYQQFRQQEYLLFTVSNQPLPYIASLFGFARQSVVVNAEYSMKRHNGYPITDSLHFYGDIQRGRTLELPAGTSCFSRVASWNDQQRAILGEDYEDFDGVALPPGRYHINIRLTFGTKKKLYKRSFVIGDEQDAMMWLPHNEYWHT
jgi:hypothetical protein